HSNGNEANAESLEPAASPSVQTTSLFELTSYDQVVPQGTGTCPVTTTSLCTTPLAMISIPNKVVWPYVQQWHLDVQRELWGHTVATASYVGSKGTHLTRFFDINQVLSTSLSQNPYKVGEPLNGVDSGGQPNDDCATMETPSGVPVTGQAANNLAIACGASPDGFRTPFPGIGAVDHLEEKASSIYHSLQLSLRRSVGWLTLSGSYTYSHSIDDSSSAHDPLIIDSYDLARVRASSN